VPKGTKASAEELISWTMAARALALYKGKYVIFVGEWLGGCADPSFFALLDAYYCEVATVTLPEWFMRDDSLVIFQRRRQLRPAH
jgi:hypothetical protein